MKNWDVVALGELLIDFTPAGLSPAGMKLFEQNPGGAPANMLTAVSRSGLKTAFIGKIGADMHGDFLRSTLEGIPIDTSGLITDPSVFTTLAFVSLSITGDRGFSFARKPGADTRLSIDEINKDMLTDTKIFHVGSLSLTDEPARTATFEAVKIAKDAGAIISYDPNYRAPLWENVDKAMEMMRLMVQFADVMKISDEETELLTPFGDPLEAGKYLIENGVKLAVVTLGAKGALVVSASGYVEVPGFKSTVVDTTGAGDSFWGGLLARFLSEDVSLDDITTSQMYDIARYGNAVASLCVEKRGGIVSIPTFEEVVERLNK